MGPCGPRWEQNDLYRGQFWLADLDSRRRKRRDLIIFQNYYQFANCAFQIPIPIRRDSPASPSPLLYNSHRRRGPRVATEISSLLTPTRRRRSPLLLAEVNLFALRPNRVCWCSVLFSDQSESGMIFVCWILFLACQCLIVFFVVKSLICLDFMTFGIGCMLMIAFLLIFLVCCSSFDVLLALTCVLRFMIFLYKFWLVC